MRYRDELELIIMIGILVVGTIALDKITEIVATCSIDYYEDNGKAYYKIPWEKI